MRQQQRGERDMRLTKGTLILGFGAVVAGLLGADYALQKSSEDTVRVTVTGKDVITSGSDGNVSSKYLIYADNETFENEDALWYGKYNSSDVQRTLEAGKTYDLKVNGYRIPFFSVYRNILKARPVQASTPSGPGSW